MMIYFNDMKFKNFLSYGNNFTDINFAEAKSTLIIGENGCGKSTFLDALTFVLYGKAYRKINKSQLVNTINKKECIVELTFIKNDYKYKIVRGISPNIFEIYKNGELIDEQSATKDQQEYLESKILEMDYKTFTQIIVLGSATYIPFMELSPAERRIIIENLLSIEFFSAMNILAKDDVKQIKNEIDEIKNKQNIQTLTRTKTLETVREINNIYENKLDENQININETKTQIAGTQTYIQTLQNEITNINTQIAGTQNIDTTKTQITNWIAESQTYIQTLQNEINRKTQDLNFYRNNVTCPICKQILEENLKQHYITENETYINTNTNNVTTYITEINKQIAYVKTLDETLMAVDAKNRQIYDFNFKIKNLNDNILRLVDENNKILDGTIGNTKKYLEQIKILEQEISTLTDEENAKVKQKLHTDKVVSILKDDGVKSFIVERYLSLINYTMNKYFDIFNFNVSFTLDEQFNEIIKSRYKDTLQYNNFSEGEKMRINLAILFAFRELMMLRSKTSVNLLVFDEILDSSLDANGVESFLNIIQSVEKETKVFVISHHAGVYNDNFVKVLNVKKNGNFSQVIDI